MSSPASGYKRSRDVDPHIQGLPYGEDDHLASARPSASARKDKPRDWRDAFLEEPEVEGKRDRHSVRSSRETLSRRDSIDRNEKSDGRYSKPSRGNETEEGEVPERPLSRRRTRSPTPPPRPRAQNDQPPSRGGHDHGYRGRGGRGGGYAPNGRGGFHGGRGGYHPNQNSNQRFNPPSAPAPASQPVPPKVPSPPPKKAEEIIEELPDTVELDPEEALAERRRKRQEILAKFSGGSEATTPSAVIPAVESIKSEITSTVSTPRGASPGSPSDSTFSLEKDAQSESIPHTSTDVTYQSTTSTSEEISAADYDPSADRRAEDIRRLQNETSAKEARDVIAEAEKAAQEAAHKEIDQVQGNPAEDSDDDDDDMFSGVIKPKKEAGVKAKLEVPVITSILPSSAATLSDNWDDADGYYRIIPGEIIDNGRYHVFTSLGKGMFSAVVRAKVVKPGPGEPVGKEVAIKIVRSQESMYKAGLKEIQILRKLREADPDDKKHIVRLERTFEHRGHLCMVFENLSMNLRDVIKRFGKDVGLNMRAVRAYAHQMFLALSLMKKCTIMHADIKPDNILVTENKSVLKVCDLGSASDESENEVTPYLVSRFYRAPEISLPYDCSLDIWSIGCTLFELYTGKILFPGRSNNQMLHHMMDLKGKFNHRLIKKSQFGEMHFDESMNFISVEVDKITGQNVTRLLPFNKPGRDLRARLLPSPAAQQKMKDEELKALLSFIDLLDKCLTLDSSKRITPKEALQHPFMRS